MRVFEERHAWRGVHEGTWALPLVAGLESEDLMAASRGFVEGRGAEGPYAEAYGRDAVTSKDMVAYLGHTHEEEDTVRKKH